MSALVDTRKVQDGILAVNWWARKVTGWGRTWSRLPVIATSLKSAEVWGFREEEDSPEGSQVNKQPASLRALQAGGTVA